MAVGSQLSAFSQIYWQFNVYYRRSEEVVNLAVSGGGREGLGGR